jgi:hypothetical protein
MASGTVLRCTHKPREQVSDQHNFRLQSYGRRQVRFLSVSLGWRLHICEEVGSLPTAAIRSDNSIVKIAFHSKHKKLHTSPEKQDKRTV